MPVRTAQCFVAIEGTPGSAETVDATEVVVCREATWEHNGAPTARDAMLAQLDTLAPVPPHALYASGTLQLEEASASGATTPPELADVYQVGGYTETVGGANVAYTLTPEPNLSTAWKSGTVRIEEAPGGDGNVYVAAGCRMGLVWSWSDTAPLRVAASYMGGYTRPADLASTTSATYYGGTPYSKLTTGTLASYTPKIQSIEINSGLTAVPRPSGTGTFGYALPCYLNRTQPVTATISIEVEDQTAYAIWAALEGTSIGTTTFVWTAGSRSITHALAGSYVTAISLDTNRPKRANVTITAHRTGSTVAHTITHA